MAIVHFQLGLEERCHTCGIVEMSLREDYDRIGDLVLLCARTMRELSAEKRARGIACPFKSSSFELEALSREIKDIAAELPPDWDLETRRALN